MHLIRAETHISNIITAVTASLLFKRPLSQGGISIMNVHTTTHTHTQNWFTSYNLLSANMVYL